MRKKLLALALTAACLIFTACDKITTAEADKSFYMMDTVMRVTAYGKNAESAVEAVRVRISELEGLWSVTDKGSEIYALNHSGSAEVSAATAEIVSFALEIAEKSGGALDPTIYPVLTAWGFTTGENRVPPESELRELLELVDYRRVNISGNTISLNAGMMLDLGAVAKGAASDEAARILRENGIQSALINLGGNIMTVGGKPDGGDWRIGVQDPRSPTDPNGNIGALSLSGCAAVTSGSYERNFTAEDGTVYGHIVDPSSGYPVDNELLSATIISPNGQLCDALSTAVFVLGTDRAEQLWHSLGGFDMLLITKNGEVIITEGIRDKFTLFDKSLTVRVLSEL